MQQDLNRDVRSIGRLHFVASPDFGMKEMFWLQDLTGLDIIPHFIAAHANGTLSGGMTYSSMQNISARNSAQIIEILEHCEDTFNWFSWRILP